MTENEIWNKYEKEGNRIGYGTYGDVYKIKNKENGYYYALKVIDKEKFNQSTDLLKKEIEIMNKINTENSICVKEIFDTKQYFYIIMEFCEYNLEDYIKRREDPITINEIKDILNQLNNSFKIMIKENIIHRDLKPKNILISFNKLDKCLIKLSDYGSSKFLNQSNTNSIGKSGTLLTMAPEVLKDEKELINSKSDIWSLGIIIYYLLFKEYPYNGRNEINLIKEITSGKILKKCENEELNDLMNKMLTFDVNERISWDEYFNHSFFKQKKKFNFICEKHSKIFQFYCKNCKKNICNDCLNLHNNHQIFSFSKIGFTNEELNQVENINKEITNNLIHLNKIKNDISIILNQIKLIKENNSIYENDSSNNFKKYYIDNLKLLNDKIKIDENIELIELNLNEQELSNNNFIICEYDNKT